jgi:hypothetical protein
MSSFREYAVMRFNKLAAEAGVQDMQHAPSALDVMQQTKMLKWDHLGGVAPRFPEDMQMAQSVNLLTLPNTVQGASCVNCVHFRALDAGTGAGFCTNPEVKLDVSSRMLCSRWDNPGAEKSWETEEGQAMLNPPQEMGYAGAPEDTADAMEQDFLTPEQDASAMTAAQVSPQFEDQQATQPPAPQPEPAAKPKKEKPAKGPDVHVHVGQEKAASLRDLILGEYLY